MLHEQAAFCNLFDTPSQYRKYASRLIFAGDAFDHGKQQTHALRCFLSAYPVYQGSQWQSVVDHVRSQLVKQFFLLGQTEKAVHLVSELLMGNDQPLSVQCSYLREFLFIYQKACQELNLKMPILPVPNIKNETCEIFLRDYPSKSDSTLVQDEWKSMEKTLKNYGKPPKKIVFKFEKKKKIKPKLAVVGEFITVQVEVSNSLALPLQFTNVQLVASHTPDIITSSSSNTVSATTTLNNESAFQVAPFDLVLQPHETSQLRFSLLPLREGTLKIDAIGFYLCGAVWGCRPFKLPQKRLNQTRAEKTGIFYQENLDLTIRITRPQPLLQVLLENFPQNLIQGQVHKFHVIMTNQGKTPLKNVRLKLSHPAMFSFGNFFSMTPFNLQKGPAKETANIFDSNLHLDNHSVVVFPLGEAGVLKPGETKTFSSSVRCTFVGNFDFRFLFFYENSVTEDNVPEMKYRLDRQRQSVNVIPSLTVTPYITLSYSSINAYLLTLQVSHAEKSLSSFRLKQLCSLSSYWTVVPLSEEDDDIFQLEPTQSTTLFFRIQPAKEAKNIQRKPSTNLFHSTHVLFKKSKTLQVFKEFSDAQGEPHFDFLLRQKASLFQFKNGSEPTSPRLGRNRTFSGNSASLANFSDKYSELVDSPLDLILLWEVEPLSGNNIVISGQHNIMNIHLGTSALIDKNVPVLSIEEALLNPKSEDKGDSVPKDAISPSVLRFAIECPRKVVHEFAAKG
jgi:hypothetical protein